MYNKRREFLKNSSLLTTALVFGSNFKSIAAISKKNSFLKEISNTVTIFYTNDLQGKITPYTLGKKADLGGLSNVKTVLKQQSLGYVLVDCGNFLDHNASFEENKNVITLLNKTGYHAVTIGKKDLLNGQAYLAPLISLMNFKVVNCNYEFTDPIMKDKTLPYHIIKFGGFKIGITGVGPNLSPARGFKNIIFHHPYKKANAVATFLKQQLNCDLVVCLSQLNFEHTKRNEDNNFAAASENIDLIISSTNKTIINTNMVLRNKQKHQVIVSSTGCGGLMMGKLAFTFDENRNQHLFQCRNYIPGLPADKSVSDQYRKLIA